MKYLQRYIKTLSENVVEKKCIETSNSTYYTVDGGFRIRLSDHFSPVSVSSELHVEIIQIFDSEDFIVLYKNFKSPMKKNRKEVKEFLKFAFDVYRMGRMVSEQSREKASKNIDDEKIKEERDKIYKKLKKEWKKYDSLINDILSKCPSFVKMKKWVNIGSIFGTLSLGRLSNEVKKVLKSYFESKKITGKEILEIIYNLYNIEGSFAVSENTVRIYCDYLIDNRT